MIREPYNITPYNSTIDTSRINEFGFNFSGDELGSWQAEVAKNNSSPEVLFTSKQYYPADAGYDRIFDGDRVEGTLVPSWIKATNSGKYDGELKRVYTANVSFQSTDTKVFIGEKVTNEGGEVTYNIIANGAIKILGETHYLAFSYNQIFETTNPQNNSKYSIGHSAATGSITWEENKSFQFVGYLLTVLKGISIANDDAVQVEDKTFINAENLSTTEVLLLNQEDKAYEDDGQTLYATPDYFSFDKYVTYYIYTYEGVEDENYYGKEITIEGVKTGTVNSIEIEITPKQSGNCWGPGMGVNKFNISSATTQNNLESNEKHRSISSYTQYVPDATANLTVEDGILSFDINVSYLSSRFGSNFTFYFETPIFAKIEKGVTYYLQIFNTDPEVIPVPVPLSNFYFIVNDSQNIEAITDAYRLYLSDAGGLTITKDNCRIIGFGFSSSQTTTSAKTITLERIVISESALATGWSEYVKSASFYANNVFEIRRSVGNTADILRMHTGIQVVGGQIEILYNSNSESPSWSVTTKPFKKIEGYTPGDSQLSELDKKLLSCRWWSSYDKYVQGTLPSTGALVYYDETDSSVDGEIDLASPTFRDLSTNPNVFTIIVGNTPIEREGVRAVFLDLATTQSPSKSTIALRRNVGEDLIWRLKMWEPGNPAAVTNFVKHSRLLQDANRITENTYEGEVSLTVMENIKPIGTSSNYVQIGDDLFIENKTNNTEEKPTLTATIQPSIIYTNLVEDLQTFSAALGSDCVLEIDNYIFSITNSQLSKDQSYIILDLQEEDGLINDLTTKSYYDYTIEFPDGYYNDKVTPLINSYVEKTTYPIPAFVSGGNNVPTFTINVNNATPNGITTMYYWLYSDGTPRAFYTLTNPIKGQIRGRDYRLYDNFYNSNWYFFQSRSTPELSINYYVEANDNSGYTGTFPALDYAHRSIKLNGTYSQEQNIGVKYYTWQIDKYEGNSVETVFKSEEIYNSDFECIFDSLDEHGTYVVTFTVVNHDGVVTSISGDLTTNFEKIIPFETQCTAIVNNNSHVAEVTWMNGWTSEPEEGKGSSSDFGNHIGIGPSEQDVTVNDGEQLTYSTIVNVPINIARENLAMQAGFVINDDAKVNNEKKEFYDSTFLKILGDSGSVEFNKLGLDVEIGGNTTNWKLLTDTNGQLDATTRSKTNFFLGNNYIWEERDGEKWINSNYWTETQSDTNCWYYQVIIKGDEGNGRLNIWKTPFSKLSSNFTYNSQNDTHTLTIPYNPLLDQSDSLFVRLYDNAAGTETTVYEVEEKISSATEILLTLGGDTWPTNPIVEVVVYGEREDVITNMNITLPETVTSFILGPRTNFFYFSIYDAAKGTIPNPLTPPAFGDKPEWSDSGDSLVLNSTFNGTNVSSKQSEITSGVDTYKIYRLKYRPIDNNPANDEIIYRRLIGEFNLVEEELAEASSFHFIDWAIENKGKFGYEIVPSSSSTGITEVSIETRPENRIQTDWYGWSFTEVAKFQDTEHYEPVERWLFKLNVETNGYTHQTNKVFHQGFNRYPKASIGVTNYVTTNVSCLIGDINKQLQRINYYSKQQGYTRDTIESIEQWENFTNTSNPILVKDYKGRVFMGVIDGNSMSFQDVVVDILTTLSFNVTQIDDDTNYQIFSIEEG